MHIISIEIYFVFIMLKINAKTHFKQKKLPYTVFNLMLILQNENYSRIFEIYIKNVQV